MSNKFLIPKIMIPISVVNHNSHLNDMFTIIYYSTTIKHYKNANYEHYGAERVVVACGFGA